MTPEGKSALLMAVYNHEPPAQSLHAALAHVDYICLIDNGTDTQVSAKLDGFASAWNSRVFVIRTHQNLGISRAYNLAVNQVDKLLVEWLYFLDHDAICDDSFFVKTRRTWEALSDSGVHLGVVVPIVADDPTLMNRNLGIRRPYSFVGSTLTSGILTRMDVFRSVGGFSERLFVEGADYELTSRIRRQGWALCCLNRVLITQEFAHSIPPLKGASRLGARLSRFRSLVRVSIGNANMFRTRLSLHNPQRWEELVDNWRALRQEVRFHRGSLRIPYYLNRLEYLFIQKFCLPTSDESSSQPVPSSPLS